jgi:hypothetical protein
MEVYVTPRSSLKKFQDINDDDDGYSPSPPPPKKPKRREPESAPESPPESGIRRVQVFKKACDRCQRGDRDCKVEELGSACLGCKAHKYGCCHTGKTELKTMWVSRPISDSDSDVKILDDPKGKKRKVESPAPVKKRKAAVKQEKGEKVMKKTKEKPKVKVEKGKVESRPKAKASGSKPTTKRRAAPKSSPVISSEEEGEAMVVDDDSDEEAPKPKRVRVAKGKFTTYFLFVLIFILLQISQRSTANDLLCLRSELRSSTRWPKRQPTPGCGWTRWKGVSTGSPVHSKHFWAASTSTTDSDSFPTTCDSHLRPFPPPVL